MGARKGRVEGKRAVEHTKEITKGRARCKKSTIMRKGKCLRKEVCKEAQAGTSKAVRKCTCERRTRKKVREKGRKCARNCVLGKYGM